MSEATYSIFVLALILLSLAGLVWAVARFDQMAAVLGVAGYWARILPATRTGMCLVMVGAALLGLAALPPSLAFYPESWRNVFFWLCGLAIGSGFIHDFVAGAVRAHRDGR